MINAILSTEFLKLKRYSVIKAGIIIMLMPFLYSTVTTFALSGATTTFANFMSTFFETNFAFFMPIFITLLGGSMMNRERTDSTMKSILTVPVSYRTLLIGKLVVLFLITLLVGVSCSVFSVAFGLLRGLSGMTPATVALWSGRMILEGALLFIAVLPFTVCACLSDTTMFAAVAVSFIYGFIGRMYGSMLNYYPIKAVPILLIPDYGVEFECHYTILPAILSLAVMFLIGLVMLCLVKKDSDKESMKKAHKQVRARGW